MKIIYQNSEGGISVIHPTGELPIEEVAAKDVPAGVPYEIVTADAIPSDRTFRAAWVLSDGSIDHDIAKARAIGHDMRRAKRESEFEPLDAVIAKQIPGVDAAEAETARQAIRDRYAIMQSVINKAKTPDEIKTALELP